LFLASTGSFYTATLDALHESTDSLAAGEHLQSHFVNWMERGIIMRNFGMKSGMKSASKHTAKDWVRLAAKMGLLFTDPKLRTAVESRIKDSVDDMTDKAAGKYGEVSDAVASTYEDAVDRFQAAADAFQGKGHWPSRVAGFLIGVGVGAGLGILLAPASGSETRETVREKAADMTNRIHRAVTKMPSSGTVG
jgi:hypothetical protein